MEISGLVYRTNEHSASTSATSRGIMAPHLPLNTQPFVQDQMGNFDAYPGQFGFDTSQVPHYQGVNVVGHPQNGFPQSYASHHQAHPHHPHHQPHPHPHANQHHQHPQSHPQAHHHQQQNPHAHAHHQGIQQPTPTIISQRAPQQQQQQQQQHHQQQQQQQQQQQIPQDNRSLNGQRRATLTRPPLQSPSVPTQKAVRSLSYPYPQSSPPRGSPGTTKVANPNNEVDFQTDVDTLMKAIQSRQPVILKSEPNSPSPGYPPQQLKTSPVTPPIHTGGFQQRTPFNPYVQNGYPNHPLGSNIQGPGLGVNKLLAETEEVQRVGKDEKKGSQKAKKRYECDVPGCNKSFFQKTHLDIHSRAHTGDKPFQCSEPGCGQRFSQLGNLKTHERRHTGEKPYSCDFCGKRFAQRGNVRAHKIVHDGAKPFTCRLDNCEKQFTQLGNLKSHQNKFHAVTLRTLTEKFALGRDPDEMSPTDRELFEYFAELYKNSNRGIKGRGKDRKITGTKKARLNESEGGGNDHQNGGRRQGGGAGGDMHSLGSPNGSCGSNSNPDGGFDFAGGHMDEDDESSVDSPYEPQLPPMRPGGNVGMVSIGGYPEDAMALHTDMAKYSLDRNRKFQL